MCLFPVQGKFFEVPVLRAVLSITMAQLTSTTQAGDTA